MTAKGIGVLAILTAAAVALFLWFLAREAPRRADPSGISPPVPAPGDAPEEAAPDAATSVAGRAVPEGSAPPRRELPRAVACVVVDQDGDPVPDAIVTWTPLLPELDRRWEDQDWSRVAALGVRSASDARGTCTLSFQAPRPGARSVVWVTRAGFAPSMVLDPGPELEIRLAPLPATRVTVVDPGGAPLAGALVRLVSHDPRSGLGAGDEDVVRARRVLSREALTDAAGSCELPSLPWTGAVTATKGNGVSPPDVSGDRDVTLVVGASFEVVGSVTLTGGWRPIEGARVEVHADGDELRWVRSLPVDEHGRFGPGTVALGDEPGHRYQLFGAGLVADAVHLRAPDPGAEVRVDISATAGAGIRAAVVDVDGAPVANARAYAMFAEDPGRTPWAYADEAGRLEMSGVREGEVQIAVEAPGHAPRVFGIYRCPEETEEELVLPLERAGRLQVTALHGDEPVTAYELLLWQDDSRNYRHVLVEGAADGVHVIDDAPLGVARLLGYSASHPRSETVEVVVEEIGTASATIRLGDPVSARGVVVDGESGEPVRDAVVTCYSNYGPQLLTPWGEPVPVAHDGSFLVKGCPVGEAWLLVEAPSRGFELVQGYGEPGKVLDLGVIPMYATQSLTVQLASESDVDWSGYTISIDGTRSAGPVAVPDDGRVQFPDCVAGTYLFRVVSPAGEVTDFAEDVQEGEPWVVVHEIGRGTAVRVVLPEGSEAEAAPWIEASCTRDDGRAWSVLAPSRDGVAYFSSLPGDVATFSVPGAGTQQGYVARVPLVPPGPIEVELEQTTAAYTFLVRSDYGTIVRSARCWFEVAESGGWTTYGVTNDEGEVRASLPPGSLVFVSVQSAEGRHERVPVQLPAAPGDPIHVDVDFDWVVAARLVDGGAPVTGVRVWLYAGTSRDNIAVRRPDGDGIVVFHAVGPGEYRLVAGRPGYWFTEAVVRATRAPDPVDVPFRRLGDLELTVRESGEPAAGAPVELVDVATGTSVGRWIEEGKVDCEALVTDDEGTLRVGGLPNGLYRWSVPTSSGGTREGTVEVAPGGVSRALARVP